MASSIFEENLKFVDNPYERNIDLNEFLSLKSNWLCYDNKTSCVTKAQIQASQLQNLSLINQAIFWDVIGMLTNNNMKQLHLWDENINNNNNGRDEDDDNNDSISRKFHLQVSHIISAIKKQQQQQQQQNYFSDPSMHSPLYHHHHAMIENLHLERITIKGTYIQFQEWGDVIKSLPHLQQVIFDHCSFLLLLDSNNKTDNDNARNDRDDLNNTSTINGGLDVFANALSQANNLEQIKFKSVVALTTSSNNDDEHNNNSTNCNISSSCVAPLILNRNIQCLDLSACFMDNIGILTRTLLTAATSSENNMWDNNGNSNEKDYDRNNTGYISNHRLQYLDLSDNPFFDSENTNNNSNDKNKVLQRQQQQYNIVKPLAILLSGNNSSDSGNRIKLRANHMQNMKINLKMLNLKNCRLNILSTNMIADALKTNTCLQHLDLRGNSCCKRNWIELLENYNSTLQQLWMDNKNVHSIEEQEEENNSNLQFDFWLEFNRAGRSKSCKSFYYDNDYDYFGNINNNTADPFSNSNSCSSDSHISSSWFHSLILKHQQYQSRIYWLLRSNPGVVNSSIT